MSKEKKILIDIDPLQRQSLIVLDMIKSGKSKTQILPDKKKKQNKDSCRNIEKSED